MTERTPLPQEYKITQIGGPTLALPQLAALANRLGEPLLFSTERSRGSATIVFTGAVQDFVVEPERKILTISLHSATELATYGRVTLSEYALVAMFAGLLLADTLEKNEFQFLEAFFHQYEIPCMLSESLKFPTFGRYVDNLFLCPGCRPFFRQLDAESAFDRLKRAIDFVEGNKISRSLKRRRTNMTTG